ncbi:hypothetical protein ACIRJR_32225 [Streptomyces sp. NPDC102402]|uniref:hypothetical protein n=1 Tax=Streptomyces sp. NPDC102402 TaxID=3366169 RepID=UPI0038068F26
MSDVGGEDGSRPGLDLRALEAGNNVYATLRGPLRTAAVAERFALAGWTCRSSSWHGYDVGTGWCQAELDPFEQGETLLNGIVVPAELGTLASLLTEFGLSFTLELYDEEGVLLRELRSR